MEEEIKNQEVSTAIINKQVQTSLDNSSQKQEIEPGPHRFRKGESGNPKGRPKGSFSLKTILKNILQECDEQGKVTKAEQLMRTLVDLGLIQKEFRAIQEILDQLEGRPRQTLERPHEEDTQVDSIRIIRTDSREEIKRMEELKKELEAMGVEDE